MADYIYLLETRLSRSQREALRQVREAARAHGLTVFLVGGAVRDLTSGAPIRDLDVVVQGDARALAEDLGRSGTLLGRHEEMQSLYFCFRGGVRLELGSAMSVTYPKPGKPLIQPASVIEDLRRRDFTANAMAISLNEGSYGLLMDPTNGVADVENRELRLVSNYGFLEEPSRMIRATRLLARLGWQMEERTQTRYENAKNEDAIAAIGDWERRYETEEIFREEDPLRVLRRLEAEGWVKTLNPVLSSGKVNEPELDRLRDLVGQLNILGIFPDTSSAMFPLLTGKLGAPAVSSLKAEFALPGFATQIESLENAAKTLSGEFLGKAAAAPSSAWKLLMAAEPESVLWMAFSSKSAPVQTKLKLFMNEWPQARQKTPYQQMGELRITSDLPGYEALLEDLFFAAMDGKLDSPEAIKGFLEPFSPPAAPPPPTLRRRAAKRESKASKSRSKKQALVESVPDLGEAALDASETDPTTVEGGSPAVSSNPSTPDPQASPAQEVEKESSPKASEAKPASKPTLVAAKITPPESAGAKTPLAQAKASSSGKKQAAKAVVEPVKVAASSKAAAPAKKAVPTDTSKPRSTESSSKSAKTTAKTLPAKAVAKKASPPVPTSKAKPATAGKTPKTVGSAKSPDVKAAVAKPAAPAKGAKAKLPASTPAKSKPSAKLVQRSSPVAKSAGKTAAKKKARR